MHAWLFSLHLGVLAQLFEFDINIQTFTDLVSILDFCCGSIVGLLKKDFLHLPVLQVVQLSDCILGPLDKVHQHRIWAFTLQKCMLEGKMTQRKVNMW